MRIRRGGEAAPRVYSFSNAIVVGNNGRDQGAFCPFGTIGWLPPSFYKASVLYRPKGLGDMCRFIFEWLVFPKQNGF